ncbi:hypothetical protein V491_00531 [Pseudogymnoascus sp. VKM F-3775]|nr:hypothetical protein V491_00531 [Pseudogymnoascus sp. VKM F-3775]
MGETNWSQDVCLGCDRQTDGKAYCGEGCRLAEYMRTISRCKANSPASHQVPISSPTRSSNNFYLPPACDFRQQKSSTSGQVQLPKEVRRELDAYASSFDQFRQHRRQSVKEIESREKCLCTLINNAGVSGNTLETEAKTADEMKKNLFNAENSTCDDWCSTFRTNVPQLFFMTAAFLPLLEKSSEVHHGYSGTVINISSISGMVQSSQHHFGYNASKAAAIQLTKLLASEVANNGLKVKINSIAPGIFPSEMTAGGSGEDQKSHIDKEKY